MEPMRPRAKPKWPRMKHGFNTERNPCLFRVLSVFHPWLILGAVLSLLIHAAAVGQEKIIRILPPDEKTINVPPDSSFSPVPFPPAIKPPTVSDADWDKPTVPLGLDEAIRVTLANSQVVRILTGVTAVASGATIYDPAIVLPSESTASRP